MDRGWEGPSSSGALHLDEQPCEFENKGNSWILVATEANTGHATINVVLEQSLRRQVRSYGRVTGVMAASGRLTGQASKRGQQRGHVTWEDM